MWRSDAVLFDTSFKYDTKVCGKVVSLNLFSVVGIFFFLWRCGPMRAMTSSFLRSLDHTQRRITVGTTLWTSDQLVAETSTWQHTTLTTDKHSCPQWNSNPRSQLASGRRPTHIPRGHWDRLTGICISPKQKLVLFKQLLLNTITSTHFCQLSGSFTSSSRRNCGSRWWHVVGAVVTSPDKKWHRLRCGKKRKSYGA